MMYWHILKNKYVYQFTYIKTIKPSDKEQTAQINIILFNRGKDICVI